MTPLQIDRRALIGALRSTVEGEIRFDAGTRAMYSTGGSNYRQVPIGVVVPRSVDDVLATLAACREHSAPVLSRGGGTSLAGQAANVAVLIDFSKYLNRVLEVDPERRLARVEPGCILDHLRKETRKYGLTFGPDPSTHDHCTLGGMIGNNACGVHSVQSQFYGPGPRTSHNVEELDVVTYRGDRLRVRRGDDQRGDVFARLRDLRDRYADLIRERYPDIPRRVSGYNLDDLLPERTFDVAAALVGTESTCVTVLEATVRLIDEPPARSLLALGYPDAADAADAVPEVLEAKPIGLEGIDDVLIQDMQVLHMREDYVRMLPEGRGWLMVEFGGETREEADAQAEALRRRVDCVDAKLFDDPEQERHLWEVREAALGATAFLPGRADAYEGWEDSAVPPERVGDYIRELRKLMANYGYESTLYGHYGQGCIHARFTFDLKTANGIARYRAFVDEAADLVLSLGGSLSGEHGDGQSRAELLPKMFGEELVQAFGEFKSIWDPDGRMNPGKVVEPNPITSNLRFGVDYAPRRTRTRFAYRDDGFDFAHATERCVGVGKCRRIEGGVMCPSFMVTREEKHSTRGRARLLFEMLQGDPIDTFWRSDEVLDALDLCLACKGCTYECPVHVDMPTYKAEFLHHHYARRVRPRHAYAFGVIDRAARLASFAPGAANAFARTRVAKRLAGVAPQRTLPSFATRTLRDWFFERGERNVGARRLVLWPDTFANYFATDVGRAAVEALEHAGHHVTIPRHHLCCGRPLYDYGMLGRAERYLRVVLDRLRDEIRDGLPVVAVEPSCAAVFKDELVKLLPHEEDARRLSKQAFHFGEFLARDETFRPPPLAGRALLHGHCHQRATRGFDGTREVLARMGLELEIPDSGCCGMAGAWGYEQAHYDVSIACGERVLFPAVREQPPETLLVTDGFSCRNQIEHGTGRRAFHLAQVLRLAQTGTVPAKP